MESTCCCSQCLGPEEGEGGGEFVVEDPVVEVTEQTFPDFFIVEDELDFSALTAIWN